MEQAQSQLENVQIDVQNEFDGEKKEQIKQIITKTADQFLQIDHDYEIVIQISDQQQIDSKVGKHIVFTIKCQDQEGNHEVQRRYSDFYAFRNSLFLKWPGCYVPPIPSKKMFGNLEQSFIEERKNFLQYFCVQISLLKQMFYSDEGKIFFRMKSQDVEGLIAGLPTLTTEDLTHRLKFHYQILSQKQVDSNIIAKIEIFKGILQKSVIISLKTILKSADTLQQNKKTVQGLYSFVICKLFPDYEKYVGGELIGIDNKTLIFTTNETIKDISKQIEEKENINSFNDFFYFLKIEQKEAKSFLEIILKKEEIQNNCEKLLKKRQDYQQNVQKLKQGQNTVKSFFSLETKDQNIAELEQKIIQTQKEIDDQTFLANYMTIIIGHIEIEKFKINKQQKYKNILSGIAEAEIQQCEQQLQMWKNVKKALSIEEIQ